MKPYKTKYIEFSLKKIGIKKGDSVFVNPEIFKLGKYKDAKNKTEYYKNFYSVIKKIIGIKGTVCINTYTFDTLRFKKEFIYEDSKCTSGEFSSLILSQKNSIRSNHPVFSVAAIGRLSKFICQNNSFHNYGYNSPYHKFIRINGKILNLGMDPWRNPFNHVAEFLAGVPYAYNKPTVVKYFKKSKKRNLLFSSYVRYLNFELKPNYKIIAKELAKKKLIKKSNLGDGFLYSVNAKKYTDLCINILSNNQFAFINKNLYKQSILQ